MEIKRWHKCDKCSLFTQNKKLCILCLADKNLKNIINKANNYNGEKYDIKI